MILQLLGLLEKALLAKLLDIQLRGVNLRLGLIQLFFFLIQGRFAGVVFILLLAQFLLLLGKGGFRLLLLRLVFLIAGVVFRLALGELFLIRLDFRLSGGDLAGGLLQLLPGVFHCQLAVAQLLFCVIQLLPALVQFGPGVIQLLLGISLFLVEFFLRVVNFLLGLLADFFIPYGGALLSQFLQLSGYRIYHGVIIC